MLAINLTVTDFDKLLWNYRNARRMCLSWMMDEPPVSGEGYTVVSRFLAHYETVERYRQVMISRKMDVSSKIKSNADWDTILLDRLQELYWPLVGGHANVTAFFDEGMTLLQLEAQGKAA